MTPRDIDSCALGAAANACGIERFDGTYKRIDAIIKDWPWLGFKSGHNRYFSKYLNDIVTKFDYQVCEGKMTLEQLVDYVRYIEPECGECNEFECKCVNQPQEVEECQNISSI
jgi:hypothetical protein